jgi:hypothetical protein
MSQPTRQVFSEEFQDFQNAADSVAELLMAFDDEGMDKAAAIGGALTQLIFHLMTTAPDQKAAMELLSTCIQNATIYKDAGPRVNIH